LLLLDGYDDADDDAEEDLIVPLEDDLIVDLASEEREELLLGKLDQIKSHSNSDNIDLTASQEDNVSATSPGARGRNGPAGAGSAKNVPFNTTSDTGTESETGRFVGTRMC
jgi:hypothetical protein